MLISSFAEDLETLKSRHLLRVLRAITPLEGNRCLYEDREITLFCGNDYLGLSRHPEMVKAMTEAAKTHGTGAGAARLISGTSGLHVRLETEIAAFKQTESALVFSAGYLANLGVLTAFAGSDDVIVMDKLCHASLIDAARLSGAKLRVFPHKNYRRCEEILKNSKARRRLLVTDTVFSMDGDLADLKEMVRLRNAYDAFLVADDAHGTGVLGKTGAGAYEDDALAGQIDVITGTLSKAVGCLGGFAAGPQNIIDYLLNHARPFIFATALPPALCAAAIRAFRLMREDADLKGRLWRRVEQAAEGLHAQGGFSGPAASPILPVLIGSEQEALKVSEALLEAGFLIPAIRYPTVSKNKARLRLTVNSNHSEADISGLLKALKETKKL